MYSINKIAIVGPLSPPAGGMANLTFKLSEAISQQDIEVDIIQTNSPYKFKIIEKLKGIRAVFRLFPYIFSLYRKTKHADVVHIMANSGWSWYLFSVPAIFISKLNGKPIVVNYHGGNAENFFANSWKWVDKSLQQVHCLIVPSKFLNAVFGRYGRDSIIIPNVLDTTIFTKNNREFDQNNLHLIVTRNLEQIYGIHIIIKSFKIIVDKYPNTQLSIAGSGPDLEALKEQVEEYKLSNNITFTGRLEANEIALLYQSADIMLNASTIDNAPSSLLEALACGIPVVTSDVGGIPDMLSHEYDALLVKKDDVLDISKQVFRLIDDQGLRESLVDNGLDTVQKYEWLIVWQQLLSCYQLAQKVWETENV
ncbi:glycosyltransferase family 4 protein [Colwellia ponticola]|uniref:Glycosyltransferase family 4 protein n=1 Tax=Colwellia ponticola TaxID=2304625 RepID=A0A8H2PLW9_9GAMM|nr:glycosyltransferase family 4 protein [Colwellia ponticola]TMM45264.1 glycosyltransferase family 4 protein [Colwellia ponticola]